MAVKHNIHHGLAHELARRATRKALESYRDRFTEYNPQGRWVTEDRAELSFTVAGKTLEGVVQVGKSDVELELEVPLLFRPFRSAALQVIEKEILEWIQRAKQGEFD
ncbi:MAG: polyhydroxyalkanoic acid system family protein [Alphaproteobacteria bacterium]|nr:polyhydroxyalkanoic acid system family protein [Alphaproteobacteria bacterium]